MDQGYGLEQMERVNWMLFYS